MAVNVVLENSGIPRGRCREQNKNVFCCVRGSPGDLLNPPGRLLGLGGLIFLCFRLPRAPPGGTFGNQGATLGSIWGPLEASGATLGAHVALLGPLGTSLGGPGRPPGATLVSLLASLWAPWGSLWSLQTPPRNRQSALPTRNK